MRRTKQLQGLAVGAVLAGTALAGCNWSPVPTMGLGSEAAPAAVVDDVSGDAVTDAGGEAATVVEASPDAASQAVAPDAVVPVTETTALAAEPTPGFPSPTDLLDLSRIPLPDLSQLDQLFAGAGSTVPGLDQLPDLGQVQLPDVSTRLEETFADLQSRFQEVFGRFTPQVPAPAVAGGAADVGTPSGTAPDVPELPDPSDLAGLVSSFGG